MDSPDLTWPSKNFLWDELMYGKGPRLSRTEILTMITDSNQACMAKMIGRRGSTQHQA